MDYKTIIQFQAKLKSEPIQYSVIYQGKEPEPEPKSKPVATSIGATPASLYTEGPSMTISNYMGMTFTRSKIQPNPY